MHTQRASAKQNPFKTSRVEKVSCDQRNLMTYCLACRGSEHVRVSENIDGHLSKHNQIQVTSRHSRLHRYIYSTWLRVSLLPFQTKQFNSVLTHAPRFNAVTSVINTFAFSHNCVWCSFINMEHWTVGRRLCNDLDNVGSFCQGACESCAFIPAVVSWHKAVVSKSTHIL